MRINGDRMRILAILFILLALLAFITGALNRLKFINIGYDPITLVYVTQTSLLFAIAFGVLSIRRF